MESFYGEVSEIVEIPASVREPLLPRPHARLTAGAEVSPSLSIALQHHGSASALVYLQPPAAAAAGAAQAFPEKLLDCFITGTESTLQQRVSQTLALRGGRRSARSPDPASSTVQFYLHLGILLGDVRPEGVERLRQVSTVRTIGHALSLRLIRPTDPIAAAAPRNTTWGIDALEVDRLWNAATPIRGAGILIAHLDTGVDLKHPTLAGAIAGTLVTDANGFPIPNAPMEDLYGHGTHTAATMAGRSVAGRMVGIAPEAKLYSAT